MASKKSTAVLMPNLGIYYDRSLLALSPRMLADGLNFRVREGKLTNINLGWTRFGTFTLNGPVLLIRDFFLRSGPELLVFITPTDIYQYVNSTTVSYLTPRYETGTVSRTTTAVVGVGTAFTTHVSVGDEIFFGATGKVDPTAAWDTITHITDDTHLTTLGSGTIGSGAFTIRHKFTGKFTDIWQSALFVNAGGSGEDQLWMTNGVDSIVYWNGTDTQVVVKSSLGFTAKAITIYQNQMIFLNLVQGGTQKPTDMINSAPGDPSNVLTLGAAQFRVHGYIDAILAAEPVGDNLAIYSYTNKGVVTLAQYLGNDLIYTFRQVAINVAPIGARALLNFGPYHEFISRDGEYYFDGATVKPLNGQIWRTVLQQQDPARIGISFSYLDQQNGDLIWAVPLTTDPNGGTTGLPSVAEVEHYLENPGNSALPTPYSRRSFPFFSVGQFKRNTGLKFSDLTEAWNTINFRWNDQFFSSSFPLTLVGDDVGKIYTLNTSQQADGAAIGSFVRFGRRATADARMRGLIKRVYPFVTAFTTTLQVSVLTADSGEGPVMITDTQDFDQTQPEGGHFTTHYRRGRFFQVHFSTNGPGEPWEIDGYDTDVDAGGTR